MTSQVFKFHLELYVTLPTVVLILLFHEFSQSNCSSPPSSGEQLGSVEACMCVASHLPVHFVDIHTNIYIYI